MGAAPAQIDEGLGLGSAVAEIARLLAVAVERVDSLDTLDDSSMLVSVFGVLDRAELLATRSVAAYRAEVGGPDAVTVLVNEAKLRRGQVDRRLSTAGLLVRVPAFGEAAAAGVLRAGHLMVLNRAVTPQRTGFAVRDAAVLVDAAAKLSMHEFTILIQRWEALCDDELDAGLSGEEKAYRRRSLTILQGLDGSWKINGVLDALNGELVANALDAVMGKPAAEETRTVAQRRADALISMAIAAMKAKQPSGTLAASQATIIVTAETGETCTAARVPVSASVRDAISATRSSPSSRKPVSGSCSTSANPTIQSLTGTAKQYTPETRAVGCRAAVQAPDTATSTTSKTGKTAAHTNYQTSSYCAVSITAWCTLNNCHCVGKVQPSSSNGPTATPPTAHHRPSRIGAAGRMASDGLVRIIVWLC
jgi:hypothetical protein